MTALITIDTTNVRRATNGRIGPRTREAWLTRLANELRPYFLEHGGTVPDKIRFSCSWPGGRGKATKKHVGQCWYPVTSADGTTEIFVSPTADEPGYVASVLAHELVHACLDVEAGHGPRFKRLALAIGLTGPMKCTVPGPELTERLHVLCEAIGPYPHAALTDGPTADKPAKQTTRMLKVECPACGYLVRTTRQWLEKGLPTCPCGELMVSDSPGEGEEG
jgi:hypothetical protein